MSGIGPGGKAGHHVELSKETADEFIGIVFRAEAVELSDHFQQRLLHVIDGALGVKLALLLQTTLALEELFSIEAG